MPEPRLLTAGLALGESPRWHDGRLWCCDWVARELLAIDDAGAAEVVLERPSFPFCIDWLPDGRLLIVAGPEGRLLRRQDDGALATHADLTPLSGHPFNEVVVDGRANAYVNGIGYDMIGGAQDGGDGLIALVTPAGDVRRVAGDLAFPNGMALTPDGATLIVAESHAGRLTAFDVAAGGGLSGRRVWADLGDAAPDGLCLDAAGAVWYADVPNRRCVRVREGGEVLETVAVDRGCFSCALGGDDGATLFIVAARWPESFGGGARSGLVLTVPAPAPAAQRP